MTTCEDFDTMQNDNRIQCVEEEKILTVNSNEDLLNKEIYL